MISTQCVAQPLDKIVVVLTEYCASGGCRRGCDSDLRQLGRFAGAGDYRDYAFEASQRLIHSVQQMGVPVIILAWNRGLLTQMAATARTS